MKLNFNSFIRKYTIPIIFVCLIVLFSLIKKEFFSITNFKNILTQQSYVIIASVGLAFIMISGGMDLSIGYQMSLVGVLTAIAMMWLSLPMPVAIVIGLVAGTLLGVVNGIAAVKLKVHPLIVTLGTMTIFQGISYIISKSNPIFGLPESFKALGQGELFHVPICVLFMVVIVIVASFILNKTYFGRYVYALGSNEEAAHLAGLNVGLTKILVFAICGFFVAISAILLVARSGSATSAIGVGTEFTGMTAAVLGGVSFKGGSGKIGGVVVGVLILGVLSSGMQIIGLGTYPQYIAKGIVLLAAIGLDNYQKSSKTREAERQIA